VTLTLTVETNQSSLGNCSTPQQLPGECIRLTSCEPLAALIRKKPLTYQNRVFLRQSQCDYIDGHPWVCCPIVNEVQVTTRRYSAYSSANSLNEVSKLLKAGESVCGKPFRSIEDRIYGGDETTLGKFPW
jgi:hypothetical protein